MRLYDIASIANIFKVHKAIIRVSSANDLERQKLFLENNLPDEYSGSKQIQTVSDGINFKRPGLLRVLGLIKEGKVSTLVVASIARFGFEWLCTESGTKIVVLDAQDRSPESELGNDLVQVYCCRWNGKRRYKNKDKSEKIETESNEESEITT